LLVDEHSLSVYFPAIESSVAVRTQRYEILRFVRLDDRPRLNVRDFDRRRAASGNSTAMTGFDKNSAPE
jgi:hypothetical protein